jgi:hypothetical protein
MNLNKEIYFAIIGDVVDSRKIDNRNDVQKQYVEAINKINREYPDDIASKFLITLGDSFQGLLKKSNNILKIIEEIEDSMAPFKLRFGIGIGTINTSIIVEDSSLIDGPAYHNARFAIDDVKIKNSKKNDVVCVNVKSDNNILDNLINSALSLCSLIKSNWSDKQRVVIDLNIKQKKSQVEIAEILNIKQPSVNSRLHSSNIYIYGDSINNINKAFELYLGGE